MTALELLPTEALVEAYRIWMRSAGWATTTSAQRIKRARDILQRWPDPATATPLEVVDYLGTAVDLRPWSRRTYYNDTRAFFRWLSDTETIDVDPMASRLLTRPKSGSSIPKPLSADEEARVLEFAKGNVRAYILLALRAGLRASEIATFSGKMIDVDNITVIGKGDKESVIPTHPDLWSLAAQYPRRDRWFSQLYRPDEPLTGKYVSTAISRFFRSTAVDIPTGSIHRCRHSYATTLLRSGVNIRVVQDLMRHSNLATTAIYTEVIDAERRDAIGKLGPLRAI